MISAKDYHNRTKHSFNGYARGPETLDWDDQPNAFRRFSGSPVFDLPKPGRESTVTWHELTQASQRQPLPMTLDNLGLLLELSFGLAAWKSYGPDSWAVRCNPSSGNLHPSEAYIVNTNKAVLPQGVYHYVSHDHHLEQRCQFPDMDLGEGLWLGLSSVHWREAWKYGERAFRYCQLDAGHALAALDYAAAIMGWRLAFCHEMTDEQIAHVLGLDRADEFVKKEEETPDWLCQVHYDEKADLTALTSLLNVIESASWQGKAKSLDAYHMYHWNVIDEVSANTVRSQKDESAVVEQVIDNAASDKLSLASTLIRQRRSAQRYQAEAEPMSAVGFNRILSALKPGQKAPFSGWDMGSAVHLCLFVHKVEGLASGIYCLPRSSQGKELLQGQMNPEFLWQAQKEFPGLYLLQKGDVRAIAKSLSCLQAIASDSAFSLGMLCEFNSQLDQAEWHYRRLFWECGLIGQILYMEAEAEGFRGTGIGCFFDDEVHKLLGIQSDEIQSLYHFTVGVPFEDQRIQTLPAYHHLQGKV